MIKCKFLLICLLALFAGKSFCQIPAQMLPEFQFYKPDQSTFTDRDLPQNKMVFFIFFDPDCEHCQTAVKNIDKDYPSFKKVTICLISTDGFDKINRFISIYGSHLKGHNNVIILQDKHDQFLEKFKPYKYPSMFLYSTDRKLIDYEDNEQTVFRFVNDLNKTIK
jgi:peroxiredoxin